MHRAIQYLSTPTHIPVAVKQGDILPPCFSFHNVHKCPYYVYLVPYFSHFVLYVGDSVVLNNPQV